MPVLVFPTISCKLTSKSDLEITEVNQTIFLVRSLGRNLLARLILYHLRLFRRLLPYLVVIMSFFVRTMCALHRAYAVRYRTLAY